MQLESGFDRFKHSWPGYRQVLRSDSVRAHLQAEANEVLRAAQARLPPGNEGSHIRLVADTQVGRNRAGATVIGVPMRLEKKYRILGSVLGVGAITSSAGPRKKKTSTRARDARGRYI